MAKKPFMKPRIVRRREKLATVVQFTSGGNYHGHAIVVRSDELPDKPPALGPQTDHR